MDQLYVRTTRRSSLGEPASPSLEKRISKKFNPQLHSPIEKERTRGRYACLGHRMKHKRCPLDCPERRPRNASEGTETQTQFDSPPDSPKIVATKNVLKLDDAFTIVASSPKLIEKQKETLILPKEEKQIPPLDPLHFDSQHWDPMGLFNIKDEHFHGLLDHIKLEVNGEGHPRDEIDSWFLDDSPVTGSEAMYSSDEFDSRRSSLGNSLDQIRENLPRIVIDKDTMERWLLEPYFEALVTGCYVRIPVGYDRHIVRRIEKIIENCFGVYAVNRTQTTRGIEIIVDNCPQAIRLDQISNQPLTPSELQCWMDEVDKGMIRVDLDEINQKADLIKVFVGQKVPQSYPQPFPGSMENDFFIHSGWNY